MEILSYVEAPAKSGDGSGSACGYAEDCQEDFETRCHEKVFSGNELVPASDLYPVTSENGVGCLLPQVSDYDPLHEARALDVPAAQGHHFKDSFMKFWADTVGWDPNFRAERHRHWKRMRRFREETAAAARARRFRGEAATLKTAGAKTAKPEKEKTAANSHPAGKAKAEDNYVHSYTVGLGQRRMAARQLMLDMLRHMDAIRDGTSSYAKQWRDFQSLNGQDNTSAGMTSVELECGTFQISCLLANISVRKAKKMRSLAFKKR